MADAATFGQRFAQTVPEALRGTANEQQYTARTAKERAYKALVICSDQNIVVDAWLPETVGVDVNATYDPPYAQGLGGVNERLGAFAQFIGMNLTTDKTFELKRPAGISEAKELVSGRTVKLAAPRCIASSRSVPSPERRFLWTTPPLERWFIWCGPSPEPLFL